MRRRRTRDLVRPTPSGTIPALPLTPFTIDDEVTHEVTDEVIGRGPRYVYRGPLGPVVETYEDPPGRTLIEGEHVPLGWFAIGAPARIDPVEVTQRLLIGIEGRIGALPVLARLDPDPDPRLRRLPIRVGDEHYTLIAAGLFPRVGLHRDDHRQLAAFTVRGRRPHRLDVEASPTEVVLTMFVTRFVLRLAHGA